MLGNFPEIIREKEGKIICLFFSFHKRKKKETFKKEKNEYHFFVLLKCVINDIY